MRQFVHLAFPHLIRTERVKRRNNLKNMGVTGWNRVLTEHGYLPDSTTTSCSCCSTSLWNEEHMNHNTGSATMTPGRNNESTGNPGPTNVEFYFHQNAGSTTTGTTADASSQEPLQPSKYVKIKYGSEFHVDGYGLCYHIIATAYARHMNSVLHSKMNHVERPCVRTTITNLSCDQARQLNPNFAIPNQLIHEVTKEFVQTINLCNITMTVYWDGSQRYIHKYATDKKRNIERNNSHVNLYHYCTNGTLPSIENCYNNNNKLCQYMLNNFPLSKLCMTQIYHTLHVQKKISRVECINEADTILALAVQGNPKAYILGFDSDFCFYSNVQYIPIPTMQIRKVQLENHTKSYMLACVISRQTLASTLHLPDSNSMIELAILMGNDYIAPTMSKNNHQWNNDRVKEELFTKNRPSSKNTNGREFKLSIDMILPYLQNQVRGFELSSSNPEIEQTVQFIRRVYNLQPQPSSNVIPTLIYEQDDLIRTVQDEAYSTSFGSGIQQPHISEVEMKAMDITIPQRQQPSKKRSTTMKDMILCAIHKYIQFRKDVDGINDDSNQIFTSCINVTRDHLMALEQFKLKEGQSYRAVDQALTNNHKTWRPSYNDTCVVYLIEKIIGRVIENNMSSIFTQLNSPFMIFDPYKYFVQLLLVREGNNIGYAATMSPPARASTNSSTTNTPTTLTQPLPPTVAAPKQSRNGGKGKRKSKETELKYGTDKSNDTIAIASSGNNANNESIADDDDDDDNGDAKVEEFPAESRPVLPVDEFEDKIIQSVYANRVTIIQGETGCGKSSRIPIMLLRAAPPPRSPHHESKMFVSQPRRIAAKALVERLRTVEPDFRENIALRMGHGVREYESKLTRAFFVTTGYLVRLLANAPDAFTKVTYLIIDEVHERSVDTDILCLLCRRLLHSNDQIRLVLMSATLAAALYQEYFDVSLPVIKVGARRFPVEEVYLSDISKTVQLGNKAKHVKILSEGCLKMKCNQTPPMSYMESLFAVAAYLATTVGKPGSSVLIFVTGMNDIVAIMDIVEGTVVPGTTFTCIPIHSDIPFEDQMTAFDEARPDEVKIIIATNAAESSVTLPDVDSVICLGLCKQIEYNPTSHRQMLSPTWISRASATQRAGRTGRLRPGTVYRLYEREIFTTYMDEFEQGEMVRVPLDNVILQLKQMINDERVTDVLASCLEPPNLRTIDRSFESLFQSNFITSPLDNDLCQITQLGHFVSALGIDLSLGSLIGLGIQFGVGAEAIQLAGILSFPKTPWIQSNPLYHDAREFNSMTSTTFISRCYFDANLFSEPMAVMNLLWEYNKIPLGHEFKWSRKHGIHLPRLKRLSSTCINLTRRVSDFLKIPNDFIEVSTPPRSMPHGKITILRILQVWVFNETLIQFNPTSVLLEKSQSEVVVPLWQNSARIEKKNLDQIFIDPNRHPFSLIGQSCVETKGSFPFGTDDEQGRVDILENLQDRLVSYSTEKEIEVIYVTFKDSVALYVYASYTDKLLRDIPILSEGNVDLITLSASVSTKTSRGRGERPCGARMVTVHHGSRTSPINGDVKLWSRLMLSQNYKEVCSSCAAYFVANVTAKVHLNFPVEAVVDPSKIKILKFSLRVEGIPKGVSVQDLKDLFASTTIQSTKNSIPIPQKLIFPIIANNLEPDDATSSADNVNGSVNRPLIQCIPEGVRLLSVLASSRRGRDNSIHLSPNDKKNDNDDVDQDNNVNEALVIFMPPKQMNIMQRWKRFGMNNSQVYVDANSVVGSVVPMHGTEMLYCTCSDTLEVNGGGLRASGGLTLLPPGKLFLQLCRFTFGQYQQENVDDGSYIEKTILMVDPDCSKAAKKTLKKRIKKAVEFNESSISLGEQLQCFPDKVKILLDIFNGVDGHQDACTVWEDLDVNAFTKGNLSKLRLAMQEKLTRLELEQRMGRLLME